MIVEEEEDMRELCRGDGKEQVRFSRCREWGGSSGEGYTTSKGMQVEEAWNNRGSMKITS